MFACWLCACLSVSVSVQMLEEQKNVHATIFMWHVNYTLVWLFLSFSLYLNVGFQITSQEFYTGNNFACASTYYDVIY